MRFRLVPKSVTLNDLERRNGPYFALFHGIRVRCRRKTITSVSKSILLIVCDHINMICGLVIVEIRKLVQWAYRRWPLHVQCRRKKVDVRYLIS